MATIIDLKETPSKGQKAVLLFWAPWHEDSVEGGAMDAVFRALAAAAASSDILFGRVQAEECKTLSTLYKVTAVPTFVLVDTSGSVMEKFEGNEDVAKITQAVQRLAEQKQDTTTSTTEVVSTEEEQLTKRLTGLIRSSSVMLFMKGSPAAPRCGFSRQAVELLQQENIPFGSFDILTDDVVRQGLKKHSNWPTYPQLYVNGELTGGLDIMKEMKEEGSLKDQLDIQDLPQSTTNQQQQSLDDRLKQLISRQRVMLFMKGLPSAPRCGFSRQMVEILDGQSISYDAFDILTDEEVRQGLKKYSDWPTYPQLYVNGDLIGGLDIVKELVEDGSLKETLQG